MSFVAEHGEPMAANDYDGDRACPYENCENTADWLVMTDRNVAFFTCEECSRQNRIWVRENELLESDVDERLLQQVGEEIGEELTESIEESDR